jgi:hypothetical protein
MFLTYLHRSNGSDYAVAGARITPSCAGSSASRPESAPRRYRRARSGSTPSRPRRNRFRSRPPV